MRLCFSWWSASLCIVIKTGGVVGFVGQVEKFFFLQLLSGAVCSALADHRMERKGSLA